MRDIDGRRPSLREIVTRRMRAVAELEDLGLVRAESFDDFLDLTRQRRNDVLEAYLKMSTREGDVLELVRILSSWSGDQADKVTLTQSFGSFDRSFIHSPLGIDTQARFTQAALADMDRIAHETRIRRQSILFDVAIQQGQMPIGIDVNPLLERAEQRGLEPLAPVVNVVATVSS